MTTDDAAKGPVKPSGRAYPPVQQAENRRDALAFAVNRPRAFGGMMQTAPNADEIVREAAKFAKFLAGEEA